MRRQATLTAGSAVLCVIDLLLAPAFLLAAAFAGDAPGPSVSVQRAILALVVTAGAAVVCPIVAFVAGLAGAPKRFVLVMAAIPLLALGGFIALLVVASQ